MELGIPVVMAVNMIDIVNKNGDKINVAKLAEKLGCPVVEISALKLTGIENATRKAIELAQKKSAAAAVHKFAPEVESVIDVSYTHLQKQNVCGIWNFLIRIRRICSIRMKKIIAALRMWQWQIGSTDMNMP